VEALDRKDSQVIEEMMQVSNARLLPQIQFKSACRKSSEAETEFELQPKKVHRQLEK
jgi:hypothetical protein